MFGLQFVNEVENVQREMDQLFRGLGFAPAYGSQPKQIEFHATENETSHSVKASLPGLDSQSLEISVLGRRLTISGEFIVPEIPEESRWHRQERRRGKFEQNIQLSTNLDIEKIEAEYADGILSITLPKSVSALPKKIAVKVNE
ncbi:Hsp20/alpha crystallin family protein [uncultured Desulfuromusa sp.]|uniref:Hsp20/alpha crystallin family protein n=1 Tax=uncultured Desulfuromusa sp. TaxID=219183 RepID=UPI002AA62E38|nr:Hsp20/alpha crystallin family protein [uncultured Desulfuromusa sp.]